MKKPAIPAVSIPDNRLAALLRPMKENIEILTGTRSGRLTELADGASTAEIISKINAIIARLNA